MGSLVNNRIGPGQRTNAAARFTLCPWSWYDEGQLNDSGRPGCRSPVTQKKGIVFMSEVKRRELFPGVWLRAVHTNQFKSAYLSVTLMAPLDGGTAAENALIPSVLRRGTRTHPDMESMSAALDELYGGAVEPVVRKKGETQCVGLVASFLDDAYTLEGEPILESAAALLGQVLLDPCTEMFGLTGCP